MRVGHVGLLLTSNMFTNPQIFRSRCTTVHQPSPRPDPGELVHQRPSLSSKLEAEREQPALPARSLRRQLVLPSELPRCVCTAWSGKRMHAHAPNTLMLTILKHNVHCVNQTSERALVRVVALQFVLWWWCPHSQLQQPRAQQIRRHMRGEFHMQL